ncbi:MAG: hypothetical protein LBR65_02185 [Culturomica sp.]|jgi:hypothetical protein|nr:hypothetical protein [Culturomica sp.]
MKKIVTNSQNQIVWVIDTIDEYDLNNLDGKEIDAIFIDLPIESSSYVVNLIIQIRQNRWTKLYLKPIFTTISIEFFFASHAKELIDGIEESVDAPNFITKTDEINKIIDKYIDLPADKYPLLTVYTLQLLRYNYARRKDLTFKLSEQSMIGYTRPLLFIANPTGELLIEILGELARIAKDGYIDKKFQDKLHLCPQCHSIHLIYRETCVKCNSAHLTMHPVIHHFRCSNVSPEKDYIDGEKLICPKCHKQLRHLGVDYDKPSVINTCQACTFCSQNSNLVTQCLHCQKTTPVEELFPFTLFGYSYNDRTMEYLINPIDPLQLIENFLQGIIPFQDFLLQVEQAIIKFETTQIEETSKDTDLYLSVCAFAFEIRYAGTQRRVKMELYVDIMQSITDLILAFNEEFNTDHLNITFYHGKYIMLADCETIVQNKSDYPTELLNRIQEMINKKYGASIEVSSFYKPYKYLKKSNSILSFIQQIATV